METMSTEPLDWDQGRMRAGRGRNEGWVFMGVPLRR